MAENRVRSLFSDAEKVSEVYNTSLRFQLVRDILCIGPLGAVIMTKKGSEFGPGGLLSLGLAFLCILGLTDTRRTNGANSNPVAKSAEASVNGQATDDNSDLVFTAAFIDSKVAEAIRGHLDYQFAAVVAQAGEHAMSKGARIAATVPNNGWLLSARENLTAALRLYEAGHADRAYISVTCARLGEVEMFMDNLAAAEKFEIRGTKLLEPMVQGHQARELQAEYALALGLLARIHNLQHNPQARADMDKALRFARNHLGEDSPEFKALLESARIIK